MIRLRIDQKRILRDMRVDLMRRGMPLTPVLALENEFEYQNAKLANKQAADEIMNKLVDNMVLSR